MTDKIYHPFPTFDFHFRKCFLSGMESNDTTPLFPGWLMDMAEFSGDEQMKLLDEHAHTYKSMLLPVNTSVMHDLDLFEQRISSAFSLGYAGVSKLSELDIFNWLGKLLYGLIYLEMHNGIKQNVLSSDGMNMGQGLMHKFGNLHAMLQGLIRPMTFENFVPWSIQVFEIDDKYLPFSFKDEINTMTMSLKFKDFGIIACLQDNGVNEKYHNGILAATTGKPLSLPQFEEICARFYYSAYLFNRLPEYDFMVIEGECFVEPMPLKGMLSKPIFDEWQHKTYGQVLENFWKPWGHLLFEILKDPQHPYSYFNPPHLPGDLTDEVGNDSLN
ncbi:MAG: hypothetical protein EOO04_31095 [Chitinophagaceae bacterium]|nr:MAG: hypothetical protein EOO04_31095 [Chitinophagaceae bacterium]